MQGGGDILGTRFPASWKFLIAAIGAIVVGYAAALVLGWPQRATALIADRTSGREQEHVSEHHEKAIEPPLLLAVAPFVALLAAIAVLPLIPGTHHWWESNLHRFYVAGGLACTTVLYYAVLHEHAIEGHFPALHFSAVQPGAAVQWAVVGDLLANALLKEYLPFIILLFALYTISGGIRIDGDLPAHSLTNTGFLAVGALLASFIGTTGAAMVLIRPLLDTNRERKHVAHTLVFFIFIVCNCGGCLLPVGDPPLLLGYLRGVPFFWTLVLWKQWLFVNCMLLAIYWAWDHFYFYSREKPADIEREETRRHAFRFEGLKLNGALLAGVVLAVALLDPSKPVPGSLWHPWLYMREVVLLVFVAISLLAGSHQVRGKNQFNFVAIVEVAVLFVGIFICMQPALQLLDAHGAALGLDNPTKFFWATGALSSFLDNAPTYMVTFEAAKSMTAAGGHGFLSLPGGQFIPTNLLVAISLGAVFMGSMTYIGNGPNFMVKSIAEVRGVRMPSFFGYMTYSCAILLPILLLLNVLFL